MGEFLPNYHLDGAFASANCDGCILQFDFCSYVMRFILRVGKLNAFINHAEH